MLEKLTPNQQKELFTPNTRVRIKLGFGTASSHPLFVGYIPVNPDYANKVSIKGKPYSYTLTTPITSFGVSHHIIDPASADYPDAEDKKRESSEQEDLFKMQRYQLQHAEPYYPFTNNEETIEITAYDYLAKLNQEFIYLDSVTNYDNQEIFATMSQIVEGTAEGDLTFSGGASSPLKFTGALDKDDWFLRGDLIKKLCDKLNKDNVFPYKPRAYYYCQRHYNRPTFDVRVMPDIQKYPRAIKTVAQSEILSYEIDRYSKKGIEISEGYWLDLGDIIKVDTDKYGLRGIYIITELYYYLTPDRCTTTIILNDDSFIVKA